MSKRGLNDYRRYGVYAVPGGTLYAAGAAWLGWDSVNGRAVAQPAVADLPGPLSKLTERPRRYGFHATIKPPFRLVGNRRADALGTALADLCARLAPVEIPPLEIRALGRFLALVPSAQSPDISALAATVVAKLDGFRAPADAAERARRRARGLTPRQEANLARWGYAHVMDDFRFHLTLTGPLSRSDIAHVQTALVAHFAGVTDTPWRLVSLCLVGEEENGTFHVLQRHRLGGAPSAPAP